MTLSITLIIIGLTIIISLIGFNNSDFFNKFLYNPYSVSQRNEWYRIITHAFLHGDMMHLFFNMYVLYLFGNTIESAFGSIFGELGTLFYILLYVGGIIVATIPAMIKHKTNYLYNSIGASGAVSALVFASIIFYPTAGYGIILIPLRIPGFLFGPLYLLLESYLDRRGRTNIAHDAHIYGAIFGFIFPVLLKPTLAINFVNQVLNYSF